MTANSLPEYATEDDPHEPTNLPEDLEERADRTFEFTRSRSGSGHTRYVKPMREDGGNDIELMLELMGIDEPGVIFTYSGSLFVVGTFGEETLQWPENTYTVPTFTAQRYKAGKYADEGERVRFTAEREGFSTCTLWNSYIHGNVEVLDTVAEVTDQHQQD